MSARPTFSVEYLEPAELDAEPLPDEFSSSRLRRSLIFLAAVVIVVAAVIVLIPGLSSLRERFGGARPEWLALAAGLELGAWILRRGGLPAAYIARRTVAFFLLTSLANVGFLVLGGLALGTGLLHGAPAHGLGLVPAVAGVIAVALALAARPLAAGLARRSMRARIVTAAEAVGEGVDEALRLLRTRDPAILAGAAGYLLFDVAMLGVCFAAFGNDVPPVGVLLVAYLIGQLGSLIPIPGGIGGVDGGLIGTLVLYGVDATSAAVAVLAYRGLLLAIPALLGLPALAVLRRRLRDEAHDIAACAPGEPVEVLGRGIVRRPEAYARPAS